MKITSIKKTKHITPLGGSGTGYSEPDVFKVCCDDGTTREITIDIWYKTADSVKREFETELQKAFGDTCKNPMEAFGMYAKEVANTSCPYSVDELMRNGLVGCPVDDSDKSKSIADDPCEYCSLMAMAEWKNKTFADFLRGLLLVSNHTILHEIINNKIQELDR